MTARFDTSDAEEREEGLSAATLAVRRGQLVVIPTDTVYGIGCDAFDPEAVRSLLEAKGRGRDMPPPVLISALTTLDALATRVPFWARVLTETFWPGPLTVVCTQQSSLQWDLGDARGTVAVRMPEQDLTLELIQRTGPLAVSSANTTGMPPATDVDQAVAMLGDDVEVMLDAGPCGTGMASTIVDCTSDRPRLLREGALAEAEIMAALAAAGHHFDEQRADESSPEDAPEDSPEDSAALDPVADPADDGDDTVDGAFDADADPGPGAGGAQPGA